MVQGVVGVTLSYPELGTESLRLIHRGEVRMMAEEESAPLRNKGVLSYFCWFFMSACLQYVLIAFLVGVGPCA